MPNRFGQTKCVRCLWMQTLRKETTNNGSTWQRGIYIRDFRSQLG